jgi:hypothetical protein
MYDLVIENANLVTCDKNHNVICNASMAIADGSIQVIESDSEKKNSTLRYITKNRCTK